MKKGLWYIFKCQNCGKKFQEKCVKSHIESDYAGRKTENEYAAHIGCKTHIVSTHKCKEGVYGCAKLVGCQMWRNEKEKI